VRYAHFFGQCAATQTGVNSAMCHLPSSPQAFIWQVPWAQLCEQTAGPTQGFAAAFRFAASDGADEIAIAMAATAPHIKSLLMEVM
jgi:hypothetical protein